MFSSVPRKYAFGNSQLYVYFHLCIQTKDSGYSKKFRVNIALEQLEVDRFEKNHLIGNFLKYMKQQHKFAINVGPQRKHYLFQPRNVTQQCITFLDVVSVQCRNHDLT